MSSEQHANFDDGEVGGETEVINSKTALERAKSLRLFVPVQVDAQLKQAGEKAVSDSEHPLVCIRRGCVLIADVSGFTPLEVKLNRVGRAGIEQFADIMQRVFEMLCNITSDAGGTVLEFAGDALFCFFESEHNTPESDVDAIVAARRCAALMLREMRDFPDLRLHGGAATGTIKFVHVLAAKEENDERNVAGWNSFSNVNNGGLGLLWQRRCICMGEALVKATELLDASQKGEILFEGGERVVDVGKDLASGSSTDSEGENDGAARSSADDGRASANPSTSLDYRRSVDDVNTPSKMAAENWWKARQWTKTRLRCQKSWEFVKRDLEGSGVAFFRNIFEAAPGVLNLFSFAHISPPELYESPELKQHGVKVLSTVGTAVAGLNDINKLVPILHSLGDRHRDVHGVLPEYYGVVGAALIKTLSDALGDIFTPDVEAAWLHVYKVVSETMTRAGEAEDDSNSGGTSYSRALKDPNEMLRQIASWEKEALMSYLSKEIAHYLYSGKKELSRFSEMRRIASVFVCFPELTGGAAAARLDTATLNNYFRHSVILVEKHGGIINQFLWDDKGLILKAAWGMFLPTPHDELNAARFAMEITELFGARAGVASGMAFCGLVGADEVRLGRVMFGAESVTLSARLMMKAQPSSVLCSERVRDATWRFIHYEGQDEPLLQLKGRDKNEPVCIPRFLKDGTSSLREISKSEMDNPSQQAVNTEKVVKHMPSLVRNETSTHALPDNSDEDEWVYARENEVREIRSMILKAVSSTSHDGGFAVVGEPHMGKTSIVKAALEQAAAKMGGSANCDIHWILLNKGMKTAHFSAAKKITGVVKGTDGMERSFRSLKFQAKTMPQSRFNSFTNARRLALQITTRSSAEMSKLSSMESNQTGPSFTDMGNIQEDGSAEANTLEVTSDGQSQLGLALASAFEIDRVSISPKSVSNTPKVSSSSSMRDHFKPANSIDMLQEANTLLMPKDNIRRVVVLQQAQYMDPQSAKLIRMVERNTRGVCIIHIVDWDVDMSSQDDGELPAVRVFPMTHDMAMKMVVEMRYGKNHDPTEEELDEADDIARLSHGHPAQVRMFVRMMSKSVSDEFKSSEESAKWTPGLLRKSIVRLVDTLNARDNEVLKAASCAGDVVSREALLRVMNYSNAELSKSLNNLVRTGLIAPIPEFRTSSINHLTRVNNYKWAHPVGRKAVHDLMMKNQALAIHRMFAANLELEILSSDREATVDLHTMLIEQYTEAGMPLEAAVHAAAVAAIHMEESQILEASKFIEKALMTIRVLQGSPSIDSYISKWCTDLACMQVMMTDFSDAKVNSERAKELSANVLDLSKRHQKSWFNCCCDGGGVFDEEMLMARERAKEASARADSVLAEVQFARSSRTPKSMVRINFF